MHDMVRHCRRTYEVECCGMPHWTIGAMACRRQGSMRWNNAPREEISRHSRGAAMWPAIIAVRRAIRPRFAGGGAPTCAGVLGCFAASLLFRWV